MVFGKDECQTVAFFFAMFNVHRIRWDHCRPHVFSPDAVLADISMWKKVEAYISSFNPSETFGQNEESPVFEDQAKIRMTRFFLTPIGSNLDYDNVTKVARAVTNTTRF